MQRRINPTTLKWRYQVYRTWSGTGIQKTFMLARVSIHSWRIVNGCCTLQSEWTYLWEKIALLHFQYILGMMLFQELLHSIGCVCFQWAKAVSEVFSSKVKHGVDDLNNSQYSISVILSGLCFYSDTCQDSLSIIKWFCYGSDGLFKIKKLL